MTSCLTRVHAFELGISARIDSFPQRINSASPLKICIFRPVACSARTTGVQALSHLHPRRWQPQRPVLMRASQSRHSGQNLKQRDYWGGGQNCWFIESCSSEARDWHIWVVKYKDILLMNYASKMFSDHIKMVCVGTGKMCLSVSVHVPPPDCVRQCTLHCRQHRSLGLQTLHKHSVT